MGFGEIHDVIALVSTISHLLMPTAAHWSMFLVESHV